MLVLSRQLDPEKVELAQEAVDDHARLLVLAPPGSGKTHLLVNSAAYWVRRNRTSEGGACLLTFTVEAARELQGRLRDRSLGVPIGRVYAGNFHALAMHLLQAWGPRIDFPRGTQIASPERQEAYVEEVLNELGLRNITPQAALRGVERLKGRLPAAIPQAPAGTLETLREAFDAKMLASGYCDFNDLIIKATELMNRDERARRVFADCYRFLLIDELQDTNLLQLELVRSLVAEGTDLLAVGDEDQMIYGWRDARPDNLQDFQQLFGASVRELSGNRRCPARVVAFANLVIRGNANRTRTVDMTSTRGDAEGPGIVQMVAAAGEAAEADRVVQIVCEELDAGTHPGEVVILAPTRFVLNPIREALRVAGVQHLAIGFERLDSIEVVAAARRRLEELAREESEVRPDSDPGGLTELLDALNLGVAEAGTPAHEALGILERALHLGWEEANAGSIRSFCQYISLHWDRLVTRAQREQDLVKVMTTYAAKGAEFDVVILPGLNAGRVPWFPSGSTPNWEEARRLFYVGVTRSKRRVVLTYDSSRSPSDLVAPHLERFGRPA